MKLSDKWTEYAPGAFLLDIPGLPTKVFTCGKNWYTRGLGSVPQSFQSAVCALEACEKRLREIRAGIDEALGDC